MRWFCSILLTLLVALSANAENKNSVTIPGLNGMIYLRLEFGSTNTQQDVVLYSGDSGQKWTELHRGTIDLLRLRSKDQVSIQGTIPSRVRLEVKPASDVKAPHVRELDFASGSFVFIFNEYFDSTKLAKLPRTDGLIEKVTAREVWVDGRRPEAFLFSVKTSTRASTWLVRQGRDWRASVIKFLYEEGHELYQTDLHLKSGRYNNLKTIQVDGYDAFELDKAMKDLWNNFDSASRYVTNPSLAKLVIRELRSSLEHSIRPLLISQVDLRLNSIDAIKKIIRGLEVDIGHYDNEAKKRMVRRIITSFETRLLSRLHIEQEAILSQREEAKITTMPTDQIAKEVGQFEELMSDLMKGNPLRCEVIF